MCKISVIFFTIIILFIRSLTINKYLYRIKKYLYWYFSIAFIIWLICFLLGVLPICDISVLIISSFIGGFFFKYFIIKYLAKKKPTTAPIKIPTKDNRKKQRTPSVSIRRNSISTRKNNQPKLFSNLFIPFKNENNNKDINYFKTSSNFNTLKNEHLRTKLNLKKSKILSKIYFNQGKNVYNFKKLITNYNI